MDKMDETLTFDTVKGARGLLMQNAWKISMHVQALSVCITLTTYGYAASMEVVEHFTERCRASGRFNFFSASRDLSVMVSPTRNTVVIDIPLSVWNEIITSFQK